MKPYKFIVKGLVQGVWYRKNIHKNASKIGIKGYVKNLPNGDVEAAALLSQESYENFLRILQEGSPLSIVKDIEVFQNDESFEEFGDFEIRY